MAKQLEIESKTIGVRFNPDQQAKIAKLSKKTGLSMSGVVKLAVSKLAESEGI